MKKMLLFFIPLLIVMVTGPTYAQHYSKDFLEPGNPGGWSTSLKTWDEEWSLDVGEDSYLDIWIDIWCSPIVGGFWVESDPGSLSILDVQAYDGEGLPGPWDPDYTSIVEEPAGPGTYMVAVGNFATVPPDPDGDIILGRVHLRYEGGEDTQITISTVPGFDTIVCDTEIYDWWIDPNSITIYRRECIADGECNDGLWCTENDICSNGVCQHTDRDCSGAGDQCNDGVCNEISNSCVMQPKPDGTLCDDSLYCNGDDTCGGGACSVHTGDPCAYCFSYGCSCDEFRNFCIGCTGDRECDGICSPGETGPFCSGSDNCVYTPNGPDLGSCTTGVSTLFDRTVCISHSECGTGGYCSMAQEDSYPPQSNGLGDACDCEGDFDCDGDCDGTDAAKFKTDFGRSGFKSPCINSEPCNGDFDCDVDVDGTDAALFKSDFGRSSFLDPCPACEVGAWCVYQ
jgi:hypothetical protein